jgi:hypothetical protein
MECSNISHVVCVVIGDMEKPGKQHPNRVLWYIRRTSITYSVCNDLVCGYVDSLEVELSILEQIL